MKKTTLFIFFTIAIFIKSTGQEFDMDTLLYNGDNSKHINMVILSDGYTQNELPTFVSVARKAIDGHFKASPYVNYINYFNVFIIKVPSNESGIDVDNYFGSSINNQSYPGSLLPSKPELIISVLASHFPEYDQAVLFINTPLIKGTGGEIATLGAAHSDTRTLQLLLHELGHSFALLRDEYWPGYRYAKEAPNMTKESDPLKVPWKNWYGFNGIQVYQHCCGDSSSFWFKPYNECQMQYLEVPFCSVCKEAIIERIHSLASPVENYFPKDTILESPAPFMKFKVALTEPVPNTLKRTWLLNGRVLERNTDSLELMRVLMKTGKNKLELIVEDTTQLIRVDNHAAIHLSTVTWHIDRGYVGIADVTGSTDKVRIDLYPNPVTDILKVRIQDPKERELQFELYDITGRKVREGYLLSGKENTIQLSGLRKGQYILRLLSGKSLMTTSKILKI